MSRVADQVREFHETYGCDISETLDVGSFALRYLRWALIAEEADELYKALGLGDIVEVADALGDLVYVLYGTALAMGIDLDAVIDEIHESNMSKMFDDGPHYREDGKVLKGPNFREPDLATVLGVN